MGFEPMYRGFANRCVKPLHHQALYDVLDTSSVLLSLVDFKLDVGNTSQTNLALYVVTQITATTHQETQGLRFALFGVDTYEDGDVSHLVGCAQSGNGDKREPVGLPT